jgi:HAD superfamily hydrolase (TIGR01509 family)
MPCKGVFFDLYGTLLILGDMSQAWSDWLDALHHGMRDRGLAMSRDSLAARCDRMFAGPEPPDDGGGLTAFERRIRSLSLGLGLDLEPADIRDVATMAVTAWQGHVEPDPDALPVLRALSRDKTLALVSNFDHPPHARALLAQLGLAPLFDAVVISAEVGLKKPDPRILSLALAQTGLRAEDVVYVGDITDDVRAARGAGIRPVMIRRNGRVGEPLQLDFSAGPASAPGAMTPTSSEGAEVICRLWDIVEMVG